jgi:hypothetical protein
VEGENELVSQPPPEGSPAPGANGTSDGAPPDGAAPDPIKIIEETTPETWQALFSLMPEAQRDALTKPFIERQVQSQVDRSDTDLRLARDKDAIADEYAGVLDRLDGRFEEHADKDSIHRALTDQKRSLLEMQDKLRLREFRYAVHSHPLYRNVQEQVDRAFASTRDRSFEEVSRVVVHALVDAAVEAAKAELPARAQQEAAKTAAAAEGLAKLVGALSAARSQTASGQIASQIGSTDQDRLDRIASGTETQEDKDWYLSRRYGSQTR